MGKNKNKMDYQQVRDDVVNLLASGEMHSTLVGKVITLGGNHDNDEIQEFAQYIVDMLKKAENFRKDNVKQDAGRTKW